ncbi:hypothetical protein J1789_04080 [Rahnella aceris]|nr:hypothetical protein [Rahnella aceris]MBU9859212.1 hypothetical protein [Rahnella aceris]MBU9865121.1 hypothetical protein [Rahnella aceris]MCM2443887.1 hypothetical protein [Rahnella sp. CG8]NIA86984.1 hypothetical protein [Rahnella aceris]
MQMRKLAGERKGRHYQRPYCITGDRFRGNVPVC